MAGKVRLGPDALVRKPGQLLAPDASVRVVTPMPFVSRGGFKLQAGLDAFPPPTVGVVALDVGASTGGFTDLLLQRGVAKVYAVDVGYGQLHQKLRRDGRVVCLERVNARYLSAERIPEPISLLTVDVSFISLKKIIPACADLLAPAARIFLLVKPQFEARRCEILKGGVVKDPEVGRRCLAEIVSFAVQQLGWRALGDVPSPLKGPKGNQEYIAALCAT